QSGAPEFVAASAWAAYCATTIRPREDGTSFRTVRVSSSGPIWKLWCLFCLITCGNFARFAYLTGWRRGEIVSLKLTDVDRGAGEKLPPPKEQSSPPPTELFWSKTTSASRRIA